MSTPRLIKRQGKPGLEDHCKEFQKNIYEVADYICDTLKALPLKPVCPTLLPGALRKDLPENPPEEPETVASVLSDFDKFIIPKTLHWCHPMFFAYFPCGNAFPNILGDMLSTCLGGVGFRWNCQPALTELENIMMDWFAQAINLPDDFRFDASKGVGGGVIQNTASDAIHNTILAARYQALERLGYSLVKHHLSDLGDKHPANGLHKLVAYVNKQAHSSTQKGAIIALCTIKMLEPGPYDVVNGEILEAQIKEDLSNGLIPFYCCASLGTTGICAFDDLKSIGPLCKQHNIWLHVDAAYGGNSFICEEFRYLMEGIEYADSIELNPYKFMLGAVDLCCLFVRDISKLRKPFTVSSRPYYVYIPDHDCSNCSPEILKHEISYARYGISESRRMRAFKLWCLFRGYGISGLQAYVRQIVKGAKHFEELILSDPRFELCNRVILGLVCFRQKPNTKTFGTRGGDEDAYKSFTDVQNETLTLRCNDTKKIHLTPTHSQGNYILRLSVNYEYTELDQITEAWNIIKSNYVTRLDYPPSAARSDFELHEAGLFSFVNPIPQEEYDEFMKDKHQIRMSFGPVLMPITEGLSNMLGLLKVKRNAIEEGQEEKKTTSRVAKRSSNLRPSAIERQILMEQYMKQKTAEGDTPTDNQSYEAKNVLTKIKSDETLYSYYETDDDDTQQN